MIHPMVCMPTECDNWLCFAVITREQTGSSFI